MTTYYRHRYDIYKDILEALPGRKTHIRFRTRDPVNYEEHFQYALSMGLMNQVQNHFFITERGKEYLDTLNEIQTLCPMTEE